MIYNLGAFLAQEFPTYPLTVNGFTEAEKADEIAINETGGTPQHWYDRTDFTVQVIGRFNSIVEGREQINAVYTSLFNRFNLELPEITVDGDTFPILQTWQISPIQAPAYLGQDAQALHRFSFNIVVTV
jgi:hypothetical protein